MQGAGLERPTGRLKWADLDVLSLMNVIFSCLKQHKIVRLACARSTDASLTSVSHEDFSCSLLLPHRRKTMCDVKKKRSPWKKLISDSEFQITGCPSSDWHKTTGIDGVWDSSLHLVLLDFNRLMNQNVLIKLASYHCSLKYQSGADQSQVWWDSVFNGFKKEGLLDPRLHHGLFSLFKHLDLDQ